MNDISAFIPYVKEHVLNIKTNGKFGLAHSIARIDDAKQGLEFHICISNNLIYLFI